MPLSTTPRRPRRSRKPATRLAVLVGGTALAASALVAPASVAAAPAALPASATPRAAIPGDEPLPGYRIRNPELAPAEVDGQEAEVWQGTHQHAGYIVEKPADWNGELVMWAHGYRGTGRVLTIDPPSYDLRQRFLEQGYAWAASSYARNGYAVATGVVTTHGLARLADRLTGAEPDARTYVAGVSMGGHVIGRSLEQYPGAYAGALPMCGVLGDHRLFDYFLSYNLVAQDLARREVYPPPADYYTEDAPVIQRRLGLDDLQPGGPDTLTPRGQQLRAVTTNLTGGKRPGAAAGFSVFQDFLFTLYSPDDGGSFALNSGRIAQNATAAYDPSTPVDVNGTVRRVRPIDPALRRSTALTANPRIEGRPQVPVLTLHGLGDLFVPFSMEQVYAREVARHGAADLLVQRAIRSVEHCDFTAEEAGTAWDDLVTWTESLESPYGVRRPTGDDVLDRAAVASPTYGCRFTDPSGREVTASRQLIPACPGS